MANILLFCAAAFAFLIVAYLFVNAHPRTLIVLFKTALYSIMIIIGAVLIYAGRIAYGAPIIVLALYLWFRKKRDKGEA